MTDYTKSTNFTLHDTNHDTILGSEFDAEFSAVQTASATKANKVSGATSGNVAKVSGTGDLQDSGIAAADVADVSDTVAFQKDVVFSALVDNGTTSGSKAIDWSAGNKQKITLNGNITFTFTAPGGPTNVMIKVYNSGASRTITWPSSVKWPGGVVPSPSASTKTDFYAFFYDGTNYYGTQVGDY